MTDVENKWTANGLQSIRRIKKDILKRKIMLNFIIDNYSWWDRAYRWSQLSVATLAPLTGLINIAMETSDTMKGVSLALSCVIAGMVKLKEYIKFSEIRDIAKSQTVKYSQLYERIERESIKPDSKKQPEDEFIYWINREFTHIELIDPELSPSEKAKFLAVCKLQGIVYDDDLDLLQELMGHDGAVAIAAELIQPSSPAVNDEDDDDDDDDHKDVVIDIKAHADDHPEASPRAQSQPESNSDNNTPSPTPDSNVRVRSDTDRRERNSYRETLKKMDPKADMSWAMDRLRDLEQ